VTTGRGTGTGACLSPGLSGLDTLRIINYRTSGFCLVSAVLMIIHDRLRRRAAHLDLRAHSLHRRSERRNLFL